MHIEAYQKLTLLDYPGRTAATIFTHGCNFRCPFCHNAGLVVRPSESTIDEEEILGYLEKRKKLLDGICITGGEPLLQKDISDFIRKVKAIGYLVKLDTNGSNPDKLSELINEGIIDYVAMDIKNSLDKYAITAGIPQDIVPKIEKSVEVLLHSSIDYEFRTTVVREFHTADDIRAIGEWLRGSQHYYLQQFVDSGDLVGRNCHGHDALTLRAFLRIAEPYFASVGIRGI